MKQHARQAHSAIIAACLTAGVGLGDYVPARPAWDAACLALLVVIILMNLPLRRQRACAVAMGRSGGRRWRGPWQSGNGTGLWVGCVLAGVLLHHQHFAWSGFRPNAPSENAFQGPVKTTGAVASIPSLRARQDIYHTETGAANSLQTVFSCDVWLPNNRSAPGKQLVRVRVIVEGDAERRVGWGDHIEVMGNLQTEFPVQNPGEFDYRRFLDRHRICGVLFVQHPQALTVVAAQSKWHPTAWLTNVHREASAMIRRHISLASQPMAAALLLGNRGYLNPTTERAFIASGTMHLLAISGLHTGILFLFILRVLNLLLVEHRRALVFAAACCVFYAFLTDLRPSVVRATLFISMSTMSQLLGRGIRMPALTGNTVLLLVTLDPGIVFDVGAWMSFLAVVALAWAGQRWHSDPVSREIPAEAIDWRSWLRPHLIAWRGRMLVRWQQMLAVTLFSMPVVAAQFHVVSLSGMLLNIVLIPFTALTMVLGFLFLGAGLLVPPVAPFLGAVFGAGTGLLAVVVDYSSQLQPGSMSVADAPDWFLPVYYGLLSLMIVVPDRRVQNRALAVQLTCTLLAFHQMCHPPAASGLSCTVLSVGHGNSAVVITPENRVIVCDAGSLHRGERTADVVARYLWHRGHRRIDTVIVSHADADHYNAVGSLLEILPVGQVLTTPEFVTSEAVPVQQLLQRLRDYRVPVRVVHHDDRIVLSELEIHFLKARASGKQPLTDNELSLLTQIEYKSASLALPGDLDGLGFQQLASQIAPCDVLVSPHHGSLSSNTSFTQQVFQPKILIVSSRTDEHRTVLAGRFPDARPQLYTARSGAIRVDVEPNSRLHVVPFRN